MVWARLLIAALFLTAGSVRADDSFRIATYSAGLGQFGPGVLLSALRRDEDERIDPLILVLTTLDADILLLTDIDYDARDLALTALADRLEKAGLPYPHRLALRPNSGVATGLDLNGDGLRGTPDDAMGYGRFAGSKGMALLSRFPIDRDGVQDLTSVLWRDLPGNLMPPAAPQIAEVQRLSSTGHWSVPILLPSGQRLQVLAYSATPPVFDGPDDRNGRRNHDEVALWLAYLSGSLSFAAPQGPLVLMGKSNLDPLDGEGRPDALRALMSHPRLQDLGPKGSSGRSEPEHAGDVALDTAYFDTGAGGLRVDILLPSRDLTALASGVLWPSDTDPLHPALTAASRHRPVWADLRLTGSPPP